MSFYERGVEAYREGVWGFGGTEVYGKTFSAESRVMYVQPNHPLAVDTGNIGQDPGVPFLTVQAALAQCRDYRNDVVLVGANDGWIYGGGSTWTTPITENVIVNVQGVRLIGIGPSPMGVYWTPATAGGTCITVNALDVHIEGFCFMGNAGGGRGVYAEWDGATLFGDNVTVCNCTFDDVIDIGVQLEYTWFGKVCNCHFEACDVYGIYADPTGSSIADCEFYNNWFRDIGTGAIFVPGAEHCLIHHNFVYNSAAQGAGAATEEGICTETLGPPVVTGRVNIVSHNTFSCQNTAVAAGDYGDLNEGSASDCWTESYCMNGLAYGIP